ncbi:hypothetical protein [Streptomyces fimbriatus]|uniref:Uncharacterized protein n=1 Tax=Streptomyces fimbriatus TaxID=68197 RepID=A0ABW0D2F0_STRFI
MVRPEGSYEGGFGARPEPDRTDTLKIGAMGSRPPTRAARRARARSA